MMNRAVFLDRDGVINRENGDYTFNPEDFVINPGLVEALKMLSERGFILIIVSNQAGISKGIYSYSDVERLHEILSGILEKHQILISEFYYCPHHPDFESCLCRKPSPLMLEKAIARFQIDPSRSYMIGDRDRDMEAARAAGIKGIQVYPNSNLLEILESIV